VGFVDFGERARGWLRHAFPVYGEPELARMLFEHVKAGGEIDEQVETREEWSQHEFHHDLRVRIRGRLIYFETRLIYRDPNDPDDPRIEVANAHDA
jgi:hypothetical protein